MKNYRLERFILKEWCPEVGSNHRHKDFQSFALPTELSGQIRSKDYMQE